MEQQFVGTGKQKEFTTQIDRTMDVLEFIASNGPSGFTQMATKLGWTKPSLHRALSTLRARTYIQQDPETLVYGLGVRCFELGAAWTNSLNIPHLSHPALEHLNAETGETTHLAVYTDGDVIYTSKIDSQHPVVPVSEIGGRCPAFQVSTGRALLAFQTEAEIDRQLAKPLKTYTDNSVTEPDQLQAIIRQVRTNGYAVNRGSYRKGVNGVAAPIRDYTGTVLAAVGLCIPDQRFQAGRLKNFVDCTRTAAGVISALMGWKSELNDGNEPF